MISRDITQINAHAYVLFSSDSAAARRWMQERYGVDAITFDLSKQSAEALAFRRAAEAANLSVLVLAKRLSANS